MLSCRWCQISKSDSVKSHDPIYLREGKQLPQGHNSSFSSIFSYSSRILLQQNIIQHAASIPYHSITFRIVKNSVSQKKLLLATWKSQVSRLLRELNIQKHKLCKMYHTILKRKEFTNFIIHVKTVFVCWRTWFQWASESTIVPDKGI